VTGWRNIPAAADYYGLSVRTMRTLIKDHGFPVVRLPTGGQLINLQDGDEYLRGFLENKKDLAVVDELLRGIA
jgi:hypothetical protein